MRRTRITVSYRISAEFNERYDRSSANVVAIVVAISAESKTLLPSMHERCCESIIDFGYGSNAEHHSAPRRSCELIIDFNAVAQNITPGNAARTALRIGY